MREQMLAALLTQGTGEMLNLTQLGASDTGIPSDRWMLRASRERHGDRTQEIKVLSGTRCTVCFDRLTVAIDTTQLSVTNQPLTNLRVDISKHVGSYFRLWACQRVNQRVV